MRHVPACLVGNSQTGIILEGLLCSHTIDYECHLAYNEQYLGSAKNEDLWYLQCRQPFPVPAEYLPDNASDEDQDRDDDNAFEYEESDEARVDDDISLDEYRGEDFSSSSDQDDDYDPEEQ
ncbi:hypothetical protein P3T76_005148 [Phytophthora citrophthora]|uniref:Uncharacterized protein n=1 Tax=Phytophthora citrophthora TaxID=4793 RepID=A0AAD9GS87_9STRA|nr:hypothetical protein P3T76_005148 [Phytophthora citrophthora]